LNWTKRQLQLMEDFKRERGYWADHWESVLQHDPDYFEAYLNFAVLPAKSGPLQPKMKEFILIAVDVVTTHLYEPGLRIHIRNAFHCGATDGEIVEVIELVSDIGLQSSTVGIPILLDELRKAGRSNEIVDSSLSEAQEQLKNTFIQRRGHWSSAWESILLEDPDYFAAALQLSAGPWKNGSLEPKMKEIIYIAINASITHLNQDALRIHIANALRYGASKAEILETLELVSRLGIHAVTLGMTALQDERNKQANQ